MPYENTEKARAYAREYRRKWSKANPDRVRATARRYYAKNREKVNQYQRDWRADRTEGYLLSSARRRAKKKGIDFNIEISDISIPAVCPVLGVALDRTADKWGDNSPSLDRRDPSKGYVKGNVRVISLRANRLKNDATPQELWNLYLYSEGLL